MKFATLTSNTASFEYVAACLSPQDVSCVQFHDALALLRARRTEVFDALLIDARLFSEAGRLILSWRECNSDMCWPTLVFGHFVDQKTIRNIFDTGIDDFVAGHFTAEELRVRVHRILRSAERKMQHADLGARIKLGPYRLCRLTRSVMLHETPIRLTAREFATAWFLFSSAGALVSRQQLAFAVCGTETSLAERTIEQHICKLRKKLSFGYTTGVELKTIYSLGYQLTVHQMGEPSRRMLGG
ncbi:DNA-binding response regulator [Ralstonia pickettii]|uniref:DNA-binding response regulator n=1 Tax=Ralstonia pickettii TaxID=329 RepID=A0A2N4TLN9_RALPI|nr:response regulator transcription factor [Ralstonia pickettii]PLC40601.1 DNA-binding response regulator [Ralstonia pickettii]